MALENRDGGDDGESILEDEMHSLDQEHMQLQYVQNMIVCLWPTIKVKLINRSNHNPHVDKLLPRWKKKWRTSRRWKVIPEIKMRLWI